MMKRIARISLILCAIFSVAFGQGRRESIAFYLTGITLDDAIYTPLSGFMTMAIVNGGKYIAVDRTATVLELIEKELLYQQSGAVDDEQITALGRQWEAAYVFEIIVSKPTGPDSLISDYHLTAKIVDVEGGNAAKQDMLKGRFKSDDDIKTAAMEIAGWLEVATAYHTAIGPGGIEMVFVRGGTFTMGCTKEQKRCDKKSEMPAFQATVGDFYIGKYVITQKQWLMVMGHDPEKFQGDGFPAVDFTWDEMMTYIERLNLLSGGADYRLPTEAEWEYAARGGAISEGYIYAGGNNIDEVAWHRRNRGGRELNIVGHKKPNEIGLYDMSGNVWEWVSDWYAEYTPEPKINPQGGSPSDRYGRVRRGGNAGEDYNCRIPVRAFDLSRVIERQGSKTTGFRLAMTAEQTAPTVAAPTPAARDKKETVAFYFAGVTPKEGVYNVLGDFLTMEIVNGGRYIAVDRTKSVVDMIASEMRYQRSGAVDDAQIAALGKQWGAKYVIAIESSKSLEGYFLSAKMVDVEGVFITAMGVATTKLENLDDLRAATDRIVGLLGLSGK